MNLVQKVEQAIASEALQSPSQPAEADPVEAGSMRSYRDVIAYSIIEGSAGIRAAEHAKDFQTANWTDALRSADAIIASLSALSQPGGSESGGEEVRNAAEAIALDQAEADKALKEMARKEKDGQGALIHAAEEAAARSIAHKIRNMPLPSTPSSKER